MCQKWVDFQIKWAVAHTKFWMTKLMAFWVDLPQSPRKSHKCNQGCHWQQHQHGHQSNHWKVQNLRQQRQPPDVMGVHLHFLQSLILKKVELWQFEMAPKKTWPKMELQGFKLDHKPITAAKSPAKNRPERWNQNFAFHLAPYFSSGLGWTCTSHTSWRPNRLQGS